MKRHHAGSGHVRRGATSVTYEALGWTLFFCRRGSDSHPPFQRDGRFHFVVTPEAITFPEVRLQSLPKLCSGSVSFCRGERDSRESDRSADFTSLRIRLRIAKSTPESRDSQICRRGQVRSAIRRSFAMPTLSEASSRRKRSRSPRCDFSHLRSFGMEFCLFCRRDRDSHESYGSADFTSLRIAKSTPDSRDS